MLKLPRMWKCIYCKKIHTQQSSVQSVWKFQSSKQTATLLFWCCYDCIFFPRFVRFTLFGFAFSSSLNMLCYLQIVTFLGFIIVKISGGLTIVLNQYLSGKELVYLTDISFLICLYDCQKRSPCLSVNYHTKMHLCVENLARSNSEQGHFLQQSGCLYVDKDGTWDKVRWLNLLY